jgi:hypothetical protein
LGFLQENSSFWQNPYLICIASTIYQSGAFNSPLTIQSKM